ncbi:hypothetical protein [Streptomyces fungicidicus]|uniref:hypothetical protein n=1 Tax=Streptomyces fungicidicus TaxID=68203 RepID=UPI003D728D19
MTTHRNRPLRAHPHKGHACPRKQTRRPTGQRLVHPRPPALPVDALDRVRPGDPVEPPRASRPGPARATSAASTPSDTAAAP